MTEFLLLLLAHILVDFYWQPTSWVVSKKEKSFRSRYLYLHIFLVAAISYLFLGYWNNPFFAAGLALAHGIIDIIKIELDKKGTLAFFVADQIAHIVTIAFAALLLTGSLSTGFFTFKNWLYTPKTLAILTGALLTLTPVSFLVGILTKPWREELSRLAPEADNNLANAGRWIGMSERILIFVFVLLSQFSAIGFLIAAKSLLRYNDKTASGDLPPAYISKKSEYVLVGTLMSYTFAITAALLVKTFY